MSSVFHWFYTAHSAQIDFATQHCPTILSGQASPDLRHAVN
jgi:hypothetical protein